MSGPPADVVARAETFVRAEAGFAQVTTLDDHGYPVCRSMTAFLADGFVVELVQRRVHRRLVQLAANPRLLVTWVGPPLRKRRTSGRTSSTSDASRRGP